MLARLKWALEPVITRNVYLYHFARTTMRSLRLMLPHEKDYAAMRLFDAAGGIFLDVGANDGMSALSIRLFDRQTPIFSVEANPHHEPTLAKLKRKLVAFDYVICAAGEQPSTLTLYTPVYRGVPLWSFASSSKESIVANLRQHLRIRFDLRRLTFREEQVEVRRLDDLELPAKVVKIDVEGFELSVLRGLTATTEQMRPVFMIAYSVDTVSQIRQFFDDRRYVCAVYDDRAGRLHVHETQEPKNLFFLPPHQAERLLRAAPGRAPLPA
jgi:FkbM family methyltransferase